MGRADGKRVKNIDAFTKAMPYFMNHRYDAMNMTTIDIPLEPIHKYINSRRFTSPISHIAVIIAAYVRTVSQYPELNRFIVNKKYYDRNELTVSMVVLHSDNGEAMNKMYFNPDDTIDEVNEKIKKYIEDNSENSGETNDTDKALNILGKIPGLFATAIPILKWADKHGLLPKAVIDASPFHASLLITNLASIRTQQIYHHIYEFGTTGISMALGKLRYKTELKGGEPVTYRTIPIGVVMDERIANGNTYGTAFRQFAKYCENPALLETKPEKVLLELNKKKK